MCVRDGIYTLTCASALLNVPFGTFETCFRVVNLYFAKSDITNALATDFLPSVPAVTYKRICHWLLSLVTRAYRCEESKSQRRTTGRTEVLHSKVL